MYFDARRPSLVTSLLRGCTWSIAIFAISLPGIARSTETGMHDLTLAIQVDDCTTYAAIVEVEGTVKWKSKEGDQRAPLTIRGDLTFDERLLAADPASHAYRSARYYRHAAVKYQLGKQINQRQLSDEQRLMVATLEAGKTSIASPLEPLSQDDLDLVDVPGCTLALPQLVPASPSKIGDQWELAPVALAPLLGISSVSMSDVRAKLDRVEDGIAFITFSGPVTGSSDGSATEITIDGKLSVDLAQRAVVWLALSIQEKRAVSDTQPGLEVTARLRLAAKRSADPIAELADSSIAELLEGENSLAELVRIVSSEGGFELLADRQWHIIYDRHDGMILRCFDEDQLIAQAIINPLPDGPPGKQLTMQALEEDVKETLQEHAGQITERAEGSGEGGVRVLRIAAAGVASDVSMQWTYYHISNDEGRRAGLTFTVQTDLIEQFAQRDQAMVETFRFRPIVSEPVSAGAADSTIEAEAARQH